MFGSILSAATSLIGGAMGARSAENAKDAQVAQSEADRALQKQFAQEGIRWKVADAKAAGIYPLYALGAIGPSYTPQGTAFNSDNSLGLGIAQAGQDIGRAIDSTSTQRERDDTLYDLQVERAKLQNDLIRQQLLSSKMATLKQAGGTPASPTLNDSGIVVVDPSRRTSARLGDPSMEAARSPATKEFINRDGSITIWPSNDAKQAIEDSPYEYEHIWLNRVKPWLQRQRNRLYDMQDAYRNSPARRAIERR